MPELNQLVEAAGTISSLFVSVRCHNIGTPMVVFSAGCFAWLKYQTHDNIYLVAAASCMGIVPYTVLFLSGPEKILFPAANTKQRAESAPVLRNVEEALGRWEIINMIRMLFPLAGGAILLGSKMM
ncbi:hypothetical protein BDW59DRAFT_172431 [Aspergillus cavernicola]|uniref:DUF1772-domain-containing protein n=1 Tax=Aspergillus cavernicola TaxID=176166 RepID=A0ABR4IC89_9EURO